MPTYEYQCEKCGQLFEVRQKFADAPLTTHEVCGGSVHRLLSAPALQFKGSGWYITDYAKGSGSGSNGSNKDDSGSGNKDSAAKPAGDSKESKGTTASTERASTSSSSSSNTKSSD
jgi:putative FmdB family regulatory protein